MTRKSIWLIPLILLCLNCLAQDTKSWLFIGRYNTTHKGFCSERGWVKEEIADIKEYELKRIQFWKEHEKDEPNTEFVTAKECVIVYEYQVYRVGWNCSPKVIGLKKGSTIESCNKQLADYVAKYPKEFTTQPNIVYSRQGKGENQRQTITEDFGGVSGKFYVLENPGGGELLASFLTNNTKDKLATIVIETPDGKKDVQYLAPGGTWQKKIDTKQVNISVSYQDSKEPKPEFNFIEFGKKLTKKSSIVNENGKVKSEPYRNFGPGIKG